MTLFKRLLDHVKLHLPTIKQWLANLPPREDAQQHYATLWTLVLDGKLREQLLTGVQPTCDINLSVPDQTKRLINLMLGSALIIQAEKGPEVDRTQPKSGCYLKNRARVDGYHDGGAPRYPW